MAFNRTDDPLTALATRRSASPRDLGPPVPNAAALARILTLASRTPDHGRLVPWRFVTVAADQRAALEQLWLAALADTGATDAATLRKACDFCHRAGALVVLLAAPVADHKIPVWEQHLTVGAVGMNLLHAAHAHGYVGGWVTGWAATSPRIVRAFCAPGESIAGFFFLGTPNAPLTERPRPALDEVCRAWAPDLPE